MSRELAFVVPGACVPKQRARKGANGHFYTPSETASYERIVKIYALRAMMVCRSKNASRWSKAGRFELRLYVCWPDAQKRDLDNAAKAIQDALNGLAFDDDSQIDVLHVERATIDPEAPRVEVTVRAIAERAA